MIITFTADGGGSDGQVTLCHGPVREVDKHAGPINFRYHPRVAPQVEPILRGANVEIFDRGNRRTDISFSVSRLCASIGAAEVYCMQHADDVLAKGTLHILAGDNQQFERWLVGMLHEAPASFEGVRVRITYNIVGKRLLTEAPSS